VVEAGVPETKDFEALKAMADLLAGPEAPNDPAEAEARRFLPLVRLDRLSSAVVDRHGRPLHADGLFADDREVLAAVALDLLAAPDRGPFVFDWTDPGGLDIPAAFARAPAAADWRLPPAARQALSAPGAFAVLLTAGAWQAEGALEEAAAAYGLTAAQGRLVAALARTGDLRRAADAARVTYATARTIVAEAMARMGARKLTALITRLVTHAFGALPADHQADDALADLWGLNARQAALAMAVAQGASRQEAARAVGISEASAKKALQDVFLAAGVANAQALARKVADAMSLSALVQATGGDIASPEAREPLAFVVRPDGRAVAFSDYGPREGRPVLIVHTNFSSRHAPGRLVEALQRAGYRPFAIDRPGFGFTDAAPDGEDPAEVGVEDLATVMRRLRLDQADLVVRGGFRFVRRLVDAKPELVGRVVMTSVPPQGQTTRRRTSFYFVLQSLTHSQPHLIREAARLSGRLFPVSDIRRHVLDALKGSPVDVAAMEDPRNFADYWRGLRMFSTGRIDGYVQEQLAQARAAPLLPLPDAAAWTIMTGAQDAMFDPAEAEAWWSTLLPGARIQRIPGAGRMLVFSHPETVVAALDSSAVRQAA
jgi:pimeloyl-ACP methyl ester carboxylesterase/DNA-binding CsgD family transcriptional regulator